MVSVARLAAVGVVLLFAAAALAPAALGAERPAPEPPTAPPPAVHVDRVMDGAKLTAFYFGKSDRITPVPPVNVTGSQSKIAAGVSVPRALLSIVGTWSVNLVDESMDIESLEGMSIWASSDAGATNVRFIVLVQLNGNQIASLSTETKASLSGAPTEFTLDPGTGTFPPRTFAKGSVLSFQLEYQSSSPRGVGPSADSTFLYYGNIYKSRIDFVTNPFNLTIVESHLDPGSVNISTVVKDAFGVAPEDRQLSLSFAGPSSSSPENVKIVFEADNPNGGTNVTWSWNYAAQGSVSKGIYTVTFSAKYVGMDGNYSVQNTSSLPIPKVETGGGFLPGPGAGAALAALTVAAVAAAWRSGPLGRRGEGGGRRR